MYETIEEMLPRLEELDLIKHLIPESEAKPKQMKNYCATSEYFAISTLGCSLKSASLEQTFSMPYLVTIKLLFNIAHRAYDEIYAKHIGKLPRIRMG